MKKMAFYMVIGVAIIFSHPRSVHAQLKTPFLAGATKNSVILRWVVDEDHYPDGGFNIYRRQGEEQPWQKLNDQPVTPIRDPRRAVEMLGPEYDHYALYIFPSAPVRGRLPDVVEQEENRRSMLLLLADVNAAVAEILGLRFEDHSAKTGQIYTYRLTRIDAGHETEVARVQGAAGATSRLSPLDEVQAAPGNAVVNLRWQPDPLYSAYHVYRSDSKSGKFVRVNQAPVVVLETEFQGQLLVPDVLFQDEGVIAGQAYRYKVTGVNAFAQESAPSQPVSVTLRDVQPPATPAAPQTAVRRDTVALHWPPNQDADLAGYYVYRSPGGPDRMQRVTASPSTKPYFVEIGLPERSTWYYAISAVDRSGNESPLSAAVLVDILDLTPPKPPHNITVETDTGRVVLRWEPNTEGDILGYHVYKATRDSTDEYFFQTTLKPLRRPEFIDEVPKGADYPFYYRIVAVDSLFNFSDFSPMVTALIPDIVPPIAPTWQPFKVRENHIELSWVRNPEADITGYRLYRRPAAEQDWQAMTAEQIPPQHSSFKDTTARPGVTYEYVLEAVDDAGNVSPRSEPLRVQRYDATPPLPPQEIVAKYDSTQRAVVLTWEQLRDPTLRGVVVFQAYQPEGRFLQKSRLLTTTSFVDANVKKGQTYYYRLRAYDEAGHASEFSSVISIKATGKR